MRLEDVLGVLHEIIGRTYGGKLADFLSRNEAPYWVIASDYVIGDKERHRDTLCYTIYPIKDEHEFKRTLVQIRQKIPRDLKNTSQINDTIVRCLRSTRRFSFCFVARKGMYFFNNAGDVRASLDATITMVRGRKNWDKASAALRRLRQEACAKSFNFRLASNTVLASMFAAMIAMFICKLCNAKSVFWFSDRDSIVTSYKGFASDLLSMHFYQACYEYSIKLATNMVYGAGLFTSGSATWLMNHGMMNLSAFRIFWLAQCLRSTRIRAKCAHKSTSMY